MGSAVWLVISQNASPGYRQGSAREGPWLTAGRYEAVSRDGADPYCLISADPEEIFRELGAAKGRYREWRFI